MNIHWKVYPFCIPLNLKSYESEIFEVLKEAIESHGSIYNRERVKDISIELN